jgi:hypothetical protein
MTARDLLFLLREQGVELTPKDNNIRFKAPQGIMTEALKAQLQAHKHELLAVLLGAAGPAEPQAVPAKAAVDTSSSPPDGLAVIHGADGKPWHVVLYRCPRCGGTHWGPQVEDPDTWWCLDCHPEVVEAREALLPAHEEVQHE